MAMRIDGGSSGVPWAAGAALVLACGGGFVLLRARDAEVVVPAPTPPAVLATMASDATAPPALGEVLRDEAAPAAAATTAAPPAARAVGMRFPDGSTRPALNGVTEELTIPWPAGVPYAPVVEQLHHNGADWYRHADGSFTTTIVRTESVSGKELQIPLCFTPQQAPATQQLRAR